MNKVSDVLAERFSQDPLETYFCKQHPPGAWIDKRPLYDFAYAKTFRNQKVFKPIATGKVGGENINFESNRTSLVSEKMETKQSLLSSKVSYSHQIPSYHTNTTSKLNGYINKLTLPYSILSASHSIFHSFITFLISLCFVAMKNFFNRYTKKLLKLRNDWLLIYRLLHYFPTFSKSSIG